MKPRTRWLVQHVAEIRNRAARAVQLVTTDDVTRLGFRDAAALVDVVQHARADLATVEDALVRRMRDLPESRRRTPTLVEGVGLVEITRGRSRRDWDHDRLVTAVLHAHLEQAEGTVPDPFTVARDWLLAYAHVDYWRSRALADLGLDVGDYSAMSNGRLSARITQPADLTEEQTA